MKVLKVVPSLIVVCYAAYLVVSTWMPLPNISLESVGPPEPEWYSGGTLHEATVAEWFASDDQNRMATAADFAAELAHPTMEQLKSKARALEGCIAQTGRGSRTDRKVQEVAEECAGSVRK